MLSSFVGRKALLHELKERIDGDGARLVTLTGTGGTGKTRLATEFAHARGDAVFVELAGTDDPVDKISETLRIHDSSARPPLDVLIDHLQRRRPLLVLDNCEHLRDTVARLAETLLGATGARVLATSREALNLPGEHVVVVPPLELPPSAEVPVSTRYEAVALLADRAAATVPGWELTTRNWPDVVRLVHQVGGLPLGIELATVRLRAMSLKDVADRLDDQVKLLSRNDRTTVPHHRTLRAVLDWSHELCTPAEQRLWARASVFAGDWDLAAAEAVCGEDVLDDLTNLVAKSIVSFDGSRYHLLEPLRQYGNEHLGDERDEVLLRHRDHYAGLVRHVADTWFTAGATRSMPTIRAELANIRVALTTSLADPAHTVWFLLQLGRTMQPFFSGGLAELRRWFAEVLARSPRVPSVDRIDALSMTGHAELLLGLRAEFDSRLAEAEELARELPEPPPSLAFLRGARLWLVDADPAALPLLRAARDGFAARGEAWQGDRLMLTVQLGLAAALLGADEEDGREALRELYAFAEPADVSLSAGASAWTGAVLELRFGDPRQAREVLRATLRMLRAGHDPWGAVWTVEAYSWVTAHPKVIGASDAMQRLTGLRVDGLTPFAVMRAQVVAQAQRADYDREYAAGAALKSFDEIFAALLDEPDEPLTPAQLEVAALVAAGRMNREIAAELHKSQRTVEAQVQQIFLALGVNRRVMIARWYQARGNT